MARSSNSRIRIMLRSIRASCGASRVMEGLLPGGLVGARAFYASDPAAVDDVALAGAGRAVVGGEEQHHAGDVRGQELALEALAPHELLLALRRQPERHLAL